MKFISKVTSETTPEFPHVGIRSWRWVFEIDPKSIDLRQEVLFSFPNSTWGPAVIYFNLSITEHFHLGPEHFWYDGPHCSFSLGYIHLNWSFSRCKKCEKDLEPV